ncbi:MAG: HIT family protein [Vicinamibacteraceae bacterium]
MTDFVLDTKLHADTIEITRLPLCLVRLMNDRRFPWVVMIPAKPALSEITDLDAAGRGQLIEEIAFVSTAVREAFQPTKMNVGALGNVVAQLHVHVVGRFASDDAWPGPVWGTTPERYRPDEIERTLAPLRLHLDSGSLRPPTLTPISR